MPSEFATNFWTRYQQLNAEQKDAVDTIDGPVMVIAGPGTGKTELLSLRVANILRQTDTLPSSILCLTFTDSAAVNMRQRLAQIIGPLANKVAVHTFHSLGNEMINQNPEVFFFSTDYRPIDELATISILDEIFTKLAPTDPLNKKHSTQGWAFLRDVQSRVSDLKREGISPVVFQQILDDNEQFFTLARPIIAEFFSNRIGVSLVQSLYSQLLEPIRNLSVSEKQPNYSFRKLILYSLENLINSLFAEAKLTTTKLTLWRNRFCKRDNQGVWRLRADLDSPKYRSLALMYQDYQERLHQLGLFDFDDMLLEVVQVLETSDNLRLTYQEQFLYILVDEYQDTSGVQSKFLDCLVNLELTNNRPNLLVVGDDDQAIFKFQGASLSNILRFRQQYPGCKTIVLSKNYRSRKPILDLASQLIQNCQQRLATLENLTKPLISMYT